MAAVNEIIAFAGAHHKLPDAVTAAVDYFLADTLAVGYAGSSAPGAAGVLNAAKRMGAGTDAPVLGHGDLRLSAPAAAFVNAFQIHCLEWDAVHEPAVVHALSVVTAAVHAVAHRHHISDAQTLREAIAVGVDVASGLGIAATTGLRFFRPATAGLMGASLAVGRLAGLDARGLHNVLGLAYSQCAGTMQAHIEGSIALPLQVGLAARAAVTALDLVEAGLTGPHDVLTGPFGYFGLIESAGDLTEYVAGLGQVWRIREVSVKPYPSGRASHATLSVLEAGGWRASAVQAVTVHVPPLIHRLIGRPWQDDMSPAYARLCLPFLVALMLTDGVIDPRRFTPASFTDPMLRGVGERVRVIADGNPNANALSPQHIEIKTLTGSEHVDVMATLGAPDNPLPAERWAQKISASNALAISPLDVAQVTRLQADPIAVMRDG